MASEHKSVTANSSTLSPSDNRPELAEVARIEGAIDARGLLVRVLGGAGVGLCCESARFPGPLARRYSDLDLIAERRSAGRLEGVLGELGYAPHSRFNLLHGRSRLMFAHQTHGHLDVFVHEFVMCHRLELGSRLAIYPRSVTPADLLLTKLQVAELTAKDVRDCIALLLDLSLTDDESGIRVPYVVGILSKDWGWWKTVTDNLDVVDAQWDAFVPATTGAAAARERLRLLRAEIERAPKSTKWRVRARAGERLPWRAEPEEAH